MKTKLQNWRNKDISLVIDDPTVTIERDGALLQQSKASDECDDSPSP